MNPINIVSLSFWEDSNTVFSHKLLIKLGKLSSKVTQYFNFQWNKILNRDLRYILTAFAHVEKFILYFAKMDMNEPTVEIEEDVRFRIKNFTYFESFWDISDKKNFFQNMAKNKYFRESVEEIECLGLKPGEKERLNESLTSFGYKAKLIGE